MSLRQVLTIYNAERQLSDDETALLNTLRRMSDGDRQMFIDGLAGKSSSQKKSSKKSAGGGGGGRKSKHASSLQQQIQTARPSLDGGVSKMRCAMGNCGEYADSNVHHLTTHPVYHEFVQPAEQAAATSGD